MFESMNPRQLRIYNWMQKHGGEEGAVEFRPQEFLRKTGFLADTDSVERVKVDVMEMEENGWVMIGERTEAGYLVMLTSKQSDIVLLPFERMLTMHALMSEGERTMLLQWEQGNLGRQEQLATSNWPGWRVVYKRLAQ
ncbi:hypothetical protein [Massilia antarctica]|uniref:hypothetical protein n=1 Tax=Massilia antarctica TaxID=2765360 RepID=UPI00226E855F|nr:hypothetical protein [Massilia sp. H27-R4]MCY0914044.1 hypothetical protein [Massilia sp. H27-R4]